MLITTDLIIKVAISKLIELASNYLRYSYYFSKILSRYTFRFL